MSSSTSSLHFLSLTSNSLSLSSATKPLPSASLSLLSPTTLRTPPKSISLSSPSSFVVSRARPFKALTSRFVRNVAISSDFEQDEEVVSDQEEPSFSPSLKLFVGNIPFSVDSATVAGLFEQAGKVEMVEVIYDKLTGRSRGFGFVTMSTVEEVEVAVQQFNGYELEGRALRVSSGPPPPKGEYRGGMGSDNNNRLYVGNLSWGVDDSALENLFSEHGRVMEARVVYDRDSGRSKGFGFVTYSSAEEVNNAIESLDGVDLMGRAIRVNLAESRPRRQF